MSQHTVRYHITFGGHRTTISVDKMLSEVLAVKLKETPETAESHQAITRWLQEKLPESLGDQRSAARGASYWARRMIIETIMDKRLYRRWEDWFVESR